MCIYNTIMLTNYNGRRQKPGYNIYDLARLSGQAYRAYGQYNRVQKAVKPSAQRNVVSATTQSAKPLASKSFNKKKPKKKPTSKAKADIASNKRAIHNLKQVGDASTGLLTYRSVSASSIVCLTNKQASADIGLFDRTVCEGVLGYLKFFNPSAPTVLLTADAALGTFQRNILFKSVSSKMTARNNYITDCEVKIYRCQAKDDTDMTPRGAWSAGYTDGSNYATINDLPQYPSDYNLFNDLYQSKLLSTTVLSPGQSVSANWSTTSFEYDPSTTDSHNLNYQKEYSGGGFLVVIKGGPSHDAATGVVGLSPCGVDIITHDTYKVQYNAGTNIKYVVGVSTGLNAMTNGGVQSHEPVADNLIYSVA